MQRSHALYEFGDFVLDVAEQRLLRRDPAEAIQLSAKVFDTLVYLVEHAGETLDKDVLLNSIWPGVIVEENSLAQNISTLRQVLGEARGENRYIATISRRGYRFVAKVRRRDEAAPANATPTTVEAPIATPAGSGRKRIALIAGGVGLLIVAIVAAAFFLRAAETRTPASVATQSLAILPFKPLLPAERNASLELGMTESLIASLGQRSAQAISPLSSVRRYASLDQDAIAAGRELGVDTVLDGSLQRRGDRLRVSVRLLRVADGRQLWAESFDENFTTIFDVQDIIAAKIAQSLSVRWAGTTRGAPYTQDPEAYALYASGRFAWTRQTEPSLMQAIAFYEQAIARDPNYALAYSGLADSYAVLGVFGMRAPSEVFPKARIAVEKALSIDPEVAAAHSAFGHIKVQYEHDWESAAREYAQAIRLDPSYALSYHRLGIFYSMQGDTDRALKASARAQQLEPLWLAPRIGTGNILYYAKRYDESIRLIERVLALDDRSDSARSSLIRDLLAKGDYERSLKEIDKREIQAPATHALRAQALALSGRRAEALAELDRVLKLSTQRYVAAYDIALIYATLGDAQNAFAWLERAIEDRSTLMPFLARDPTFEALHADPRFDALVQRVGIYRRALPDLVADIGAADEGSRSGGGTRPLPPTEKRP